MPNYNKVIMIGNLTRDPELSYLPSQTPVTEIGLATNRTWHDKDGNEKEETCFVDCRAYGKTAENIKKYFTKGRAIMIEGRLRFDQWDAKDGTKRSKHQIRVNSFTFLDSKQQDGSQSQREQTNEPPDHNLDIPF